MLNGAALHFWARSDVLSKKVRKLQEASESQFKKIDQIVQSKLT